MVFLWLPLGLITTQNSISLKAQDRIWIGSRLTDTQSAENDWIGADTEDRCIPNNKCNKNSIGTRYRKVTKLKVSYQASTGKDDIGAPLLRINQNETRRVSNSCLIQILFLELIFKSNIFTTMQLQRISVWL